MSHLFVFLYTFIYCCAKLYDKAMSMVYVSASTLAASIIINSEANDLNALCYCSLLDEEQ